MPFHRTENGVRRGCVGGDILSFEIQRFVKNTFPMGAPLILGHLGKVTTTILRVATILFNMATTLLHEWSYILYITLNHQLSHLRFELEEGAITSD